MPGTICNTTQAERFQTTPELKEVVIIPSSKYVHTNGCDPCYEEYHIQAKAARKLLSKKESKKMDDMLTNLELSDWQISNNALRGHLKLVNHACSYITADKLRNFHLWAQRQSLHCQSGSEKSVLTDKDLQEKFNDVIAKLNSNVAVEQAEEL